MKILKRHPLLKNIYDLLTVTPSKPHSFVSSALESSLWADCVSIVQALDVDYGKCAALFWETTEKINDNSHMLDDTSVHSNTLIALDNLETENVKLSDVMSECGQTIQSLKQKVSNSDITVKEFKQVKQICFSQLNILKTIMSATSNANFEFTSQKIMHTMCSHDSLSFFTNDGNIPCDGCNRFPDASNSTLVQTTHTSTILQQVMCNSCMHIFCTCCNA